jgi:hypothetical protein
MESNFIIITNATDLELVVRRVLESNKPKPETVIKDRIGIEEAMQLLECSNPTLLKYVKEGKVKAYGTPRKRYFFRSEIIEAIRNMYPDYTRGSKN